MLSRDEISCDDISLNEISSLLLRPALEVNHPFSCQSLSILSYQTYCLGSITVLVFKSVLFYLVMSPKRESNDADSSDVPQRSCKMFPVSENVCVDGIKQWI